MSIENDRFLAEWCGSVYYHLAVNNKPGDTAIPEYLQEQYRSKYRGKDYDFSVVLDVGTMVMVVHTNKKESIKYVHHAEVDKRMVTVI